MTGLRFALTVPYTLVGLAWALVTRGKLRRRAGLVLEAVGCRNRLGARRSRLAAS